MKRIELVRETSNSECGRPVSGENPRKRQCCFSSLADGACKPSHEFRMQASYREVRSLSQHRPARACRVGLNMPCPHPCRSAFPKQSDMMRVALLVGKLRCPQKRK